MWIELVRLRSVRPSRSGRSGLSAARSGFAQGAFSPPGGGHVMSRGETFSAPQARARGRGRLAAGHALGREGVRFLIFWRDSICFLSICRHISRLVVKSDPTYACRPPRRSRCARLDEIELIASYSWSTACRPSRSPSPLDRCAPTRWSGAHAGRDREVSVRAGHIPALRPAIEHFGSRCRGFRDVGTAFGSRRRHASHDVDRGMKTRASS